MDYIAIVLNGTWLKVKDVRFEKSDNNSDEYYEDCYVTFLSGETQRYDAQDITIINHDEFNEDDLTL